MEDWIASSRAGEDARVVFETKDGADLDTVRVPNLYTYNGFQDLFLGQLGTIAEQLERERWVLGKAGLQSAVERQYKTLGPDLLEIYARDFVTAWRAALDRLRLKSLAADKPGYATLQAAAGPASPIKLISESISAETKLTEEPPEEQPADPSVTDAATKVIQKKLQSKVTGLARIGLDIARKSQQRAGAAGQNNAIPGANIEAQFRRFHQLVEGPEGQRPIDTLVQNLNAIYLNLTMAQTNPDGAGTAVQGVQQQVSGLRANASRLPDPFSAMMLSASDEFEGDAANTTIAELNAQLNSQVTRRCEEIVNNRFPFSLKSKRDVPLAEFANLFSPSGIVDKFFNEKLANFADLSKSEWTWRSNTRLGRELSQATLRQFQNAAIIRDAFFPTGGTIPSVSLTMTPLTMSQNATAAEFEINGVKLESVHGIDSPKDFTWPGSITDGSASVNILPEAFGVDSSLRFTGPWALYRLLNAGGMSQSGDKLSVRFVVGGREVSYQVKVASLANPFALPALRSFSCPAGL
jgi:type VI secretion system protein ImpL